MAKVCFLSADLFHKKCNTGARMAKSMAKVCGKKTDLRQSLFQQRRSLVNVGLVKDKGDGEFLAALG